MAERPERFSERLRDEAGNYWVGEGSGNFEWDHGLATKLIRSRDLDIALATLRLVQRELLFVGLPMPVTLTVSQFVEGLQRRFEAGEKALQEAVSGP